MGCTEPAHLLSDPGPPLQLEEARRALVHGPAELGRAIFVVGPVHQAVVPQLVAIGKEADQVVLVALDKLAHHHERRLGVEFPKDVPDLLHHGVLVPQPAWSIVDRKRHQTLHPRALRRIEVAKGVGHQPAHGGPAGDELPQPLEHNALEVLAFSCGPRDERCLTARHVLLDRQAGGPILSVSVNLQDRSHTCPPAVQPASGAMARHTIWVEEDLRPPTSGVSLHGCTLGRKHLPAHAPSAVCA
mmetsp:Transcript_105410/g.263841  ORF Transcript_105410/g.263841 Transcript_105410/m.263841 type:complete len:244 (+) Transcript_105410:458-1189(+)